MNIIVYIGILTQLLELSLAANKNDNFLPDDFAVDGKTAYDIDEAEKYFDIFINLYQKKYDRNEVYEEFFKIFKDNLQIVNELNNESNTSAIFKINEFTDWKFENFTANYTGFNKSMVTGTPEDYVPNIESPLPHVDVDWRKYNVISPVKSQGACSSSYVYSTIANIESQHALRHGYLYDDLSIKQGFECEPSGTCETGGVPHLVMEKFMEAGGVAREDDYHVLFDFKPKDNHKGPCDIGSKKIIAKIDSVKYIKINTRNEDDLADAVFNLGPIVVSMYVSPSVQHYRAGVLDPVDCYTHDSNHAVLLVGFGEDLETHESYWIIKNSWGVRWGEEGYLRLIKGRDSDGTACNLGQYAATVNAAFNPKSIKTTTAATNASAATRNETMDNETISSTNTTTTKTMTTPTTTTNTASEPAFYDATYNWDFSQTTPNEEDITTKPVDSNLDNNKTEPSESLHTETSNNTQSEIEKEPSDTETSNNTQSNIEKEQLSTETSNSTQSDIEKEPSYTETSNNTQSNIEKEQLSTDTSNSTPSNISNKNLDGETSYNTQQSDMNKDSSYTECLNNTQSDINKEPLDTATSNNTQTSENILFRVSKTLKSSQAFNTAFRYRTPIYEYLDREYLRSSRVITTPESWDKFTARLWHSTTRNMYEYIF